MRWKEGVLVCNAGIGRVGIIGPLFVNIR